MRWAAVQQYLVSLDLRKNLVVVILDKRAAPPGRDARPDELVALLKEAGFRRVVVQLAQSRDDPAGIPILLDSSGSR